MLDDPTAPNHGLFATPFEDEVHCVSLAVLISSPRLGFMGPHDPQQNLPQFLSVVGVQSQYRREKVRFVLAFVMGWTEAVLTELSNIDYCQLWIRNGHDSSGLE